MVEIYGDAIVSFPLRGYNNKAFPLRGYNNFVVSGGYNNLVILER
jgi:hypothetical protein